MNKKENNPFLRRPDHPNYNRRAHHHDYRRPARYLITILKNPTVPPFSKIEGDLHLTDGDNAPHPYISPTGNFIIAALRMWLEKFTQIELSEYVIMPDHIHLCLNVKSFLPNGMSLAISGLKGKVSSLRYQALQANTGQVNSDSENIGDGTDGQEIRRQRNTGDRNIEPVFAKGFNDRIAYNEEHWERQIRYVKENPRRYMLKKKFPDFMLRRWSIKIGNEEFTAKGNILLLKEPLLFVAKHHRRWSEAESDRYQKDCKARIDNNAVPVSPFIHPKEKDIRNYAVSAGGSYIRICDNGFAERESASGFEFNLMTAGRLLLIAPPEHDTQKIELKYSYAQKLNALAAKIVSLHEAASASTIRPFVS